MTRPTVRQAIACLAPLTLALQGCAAYPETDVAAAPVMAEPPAAKGPGLWKVADEDTTIYLFGTVHALPESVEWYEGPIESALAASQELIRSLDLNWKGMFLVPLARHVNLIRFSVLSSELIRVLGA